MKVHKNDHSILNVTEATDFEREVWRHCFGDGFVTSEQKLLKMKLLHSHGVLVQCVNEKGDVIEATGTSAMFGTLKPDAKESGKLVSGTNPERIPRPGTIQEQYCIRCSLCHWLWHRATYQEASIALTQHLDDVHPGWDKEKQEGE